MVILWYNTNKKFDDNWKDPDSKGNLNNCKWTNVSLLNLKLIIQQKSEFQYILVKNYSFGIYVWKLNTRILIIMPQPGRRQMWNLRSEILPSQNLSMAQCKTAVTPLLMHWSYCSLALSHHYDDLVYWCIYTQPWGVKQLLIDMLNLT